MHLALVQHHINPAILANTNLNQGQGVQVARHSNHSLVVNTIQTGINGVINDKIETQERYGIVIGGDTGVKIIEIEEDVKSGSPWLRCKAKAMILFNYAACVSICFKIMSRSPGI